MANLTVAHRQWNSRPTDEGFFGFDDLLQTLRQERDNSAAYSFVTSDIRVDATEDESLNLTLKGRSVGFTHWSFNQLCTLIQQKTSCPADFLRTLPASLAAQTFNTLLPRRFRSPSTPARVTATDKFGFGVTENESVMNETVQVMMRSSEDGDLTARSIHANTFSARWVADIVERVAEFSNDNGWRTCPARPRDSRDQTRVATKDDVIPGLDGFALAIKEGDLLGNRSIFHGDRNTFITLVNPNRIIDGGHAFMRAAIMDLNDCGYGANTLYTCLVDSVCGNLILWNIKNLKIIRGVHKSKSINAWDASAFGQLNAYANMDTFEEKRIDAARRYVLAPDKDKTIDLVYGRKQLMLPKGVVTRAWEIAERDQDKSLAAPNTAWGMVYGLTLASQEPDDSGRYYSDNRLSRDQSAAKILEWVPEDSESVSASVPATIESEMVVGVTPAKKTRKSHA